MPYPGIIKPESIEGKLEVEIIVDLWYGIVDVLLVVAITIITTLIKETIQEFAAYLLKARLSDDVGTFSRAKSMGWRTKPVVFTV
jgi:accessory gene regulator protein AgrB